jgi:hypothetical protein
VTDDDRDESTQETRVGGHTIPEESAAAERETAVGHSVVEDPEAEATAEETEASAEEVVESEPPPTPTTPPVTPPSSFGGDYAGGGTSPADADRAAADSAGGGRPELLVAGAFVGAFVFAKLLKRLGGSD